MRLYGAVCNFACMYEYACVGGVREHLRMHTQAYVHVTVCESGCVQMRVRKDRARVCETQLVSSVGDFFLCGAVGRLLIDKVACCS